MAKVWSPDFAKMKVLVFAKSDPVFVKLPLKVWVKELAEKVPETTKFPEMFKLPLAVLSPEPEIVRLLKLLELRKVAKLPFKWMVDVPGEKVPVLEKFPEMKWVKDPAAKDPLKVKFPVRLKLPVADFRPSPEIITWW